MFDDQRSKRVVLVAHCLLNMNARIDACGYFPGAMEGSAQALLDSGVGVLQMPCPELLFNGLDREAHGGRAIGIRESLQTDEGRVACRRLVDGLVHQIHEYQKHGFEIIGVVCNGASPACGLVTSYHRDGIGPGDGAFVEVLKETFEANGIDLPFVAVRDHEWDENTRMLREFLEPAA